MAILIPKLPREFDPASKEGYVFDRLSQLSDQFFVFHSFKFVDLSRGHRDYEADFIILSKTGDLIVLEAKAGLIQVIDGDWYYQSGIPMKSGGPFEQAKQNKYAIKDQLLKNFETRGIVNKVKFYHAVCLPSASRGYINNLNLPMDCPKELILTKDDLDGDLENAINNIVSMNASEKNVNENEIKKLVYHVLAPSFKIVAVDNFELDLKTMRFNQLTEEQFVLMDFLENQRTATISGQAGTGKTMIAVERARRLANQNQRVLFLCYNRQLRDFLDTKYHSNHIDFFTIDMFKTKYSTNSYYPYKGLEKYLTECYDGTKNFEYNHIIIDEGQDFGQDTIEESEIISIMSMIIEQMNGTFYVFYDKLQLVQGQKLPNYIQESDCKITLYKNCRNTINIASTSMKPLDIKPIVYDGAIQGNQPKIVLDSEGKFEALLNKQIDHYLSLGYKDIVILTAKAANKSILWPKHIDNQYKYQNKTFTCTSVRKFKGLEADVIIMIDVDATSFRSEKMLFYVGASRAKFELTIIVSMSNEEAKDIVNELNPAYAKFHPKKGLAALLNGIATD
ncbi:nuclease-related domain-containing DEAD/DEAH box helicase [Paracholeplasma manati]|uniref:nuclease-related domain-containing DEAD/DEAH box helicase n=1 Tax=Paracholeplasma manati TaxID=591373 RepID=UPI00240885E5|nr:NERD domain-containing protein [Paracholeplasma manati]MDG0888297.1 NERD domain-containing protein [Paracholeplasma manati]